MYNSHISTVNGAQKWLNLAVSYQSMAEKISRSFSKPSDYPYSVFMCYKGYDRCMEMYNACWSHIGAMNKAYFRKREYEEKKIERLTKMADKESKTYEKFIIVIMYLVLAIFCIIFADVWLSFIEWLAPLLI